MDAIALDGGLLVEALDEADIEVPEDGTAAEVARDQGWVSPTEAWLVCQLLDGVLEHGILDPTDTATVHRIKAILGEVKRESEQESGSH
jgi:hypothetical protein